MSTSNEGEIRRRWTAYSKDVAVLWSSTTFQEESAVVTMTSIAGVVFYGANVSSVTLRGLQLSRLNPDAGEMSGYPTWEQEAPPSQRELADRWLELELDSPAEVFLPEFSARDADESADSFYQRVAEFYSAAAVFNGRPTQTIAEVAKVPKTTAARWVREARARGFLDPTTRGRSRP